MSGCVRIYVSLRLGDVQYAGLRNIHLLCNMITDSSREVYCKPHVSLSARHVDGPGKHPGRCETTFNLSQDLTYLTYLNNIHYLSPTITFSLTSGAATVLDMNPLEARAQTLLAGTPY